MSSGPSYPVELRGFEPLTPSMPWRCATNCATAPSGCPPKGQRRVYPCTPGAPNRLQGGGDPVEDATSDALFHVWIRHPARPSTSSAQWQLPSAPSTRQARSWSRPEQPRRCRAPRRTVRRDDEALPRPERLEVLRESGPDPLGDLGHRLAVVAAARVLTAGQGLLHLRPAVGDLRGLEPLPGAHVDLAEARVEVHRDAARPPDALGRQPGAGEVGGDDAARREGRDRRPHGIRLSQPQLGQRRVEVALPDAGRVVVGLAVPEDDDAARAARGVGRAHRPPCSVPTTPRSIVGQSFHSRSSS